MFIDTEITPDVFEKIGYVYLNKLVSEKKCDEFTNTMLKRKDEGHLSFEGSINTTMYKNSYGVGGISEMESFLREITSELSSKLDLKIKPANSYARIYYNGSTLKPHVDRPGLDYTMSITLFSNLKNEWPLVTIDKLGNEIRCDIKRGDSLLIHGTKMNHWRDDLICGDDEYVVQMFLHWTKI